MAELRELNDSLEQAALENLQGTADSMARGGRRGSESDGNSSILLPVSPFTSHTAPSTPTASGRHADYTLS